MKQNTQTKNAEPVEVLIKDGSMVWHKVINKWLKVVPDEKGPAYTGDEFEDDEIALSYAIIEYDNGNLNVDNNTQSKQVSSHTPGEELWRHYSAYYKGGIDSWGIDIFNSEDIRVAYAVAGNKEDAERYGELLASAPRLKAENEKLKADKAVLLEAITFYQTGVEHFFKCINWGKSFLDAEAIQFMNDHGIKFSKAIKQTNQ